jgi:hypothetical protein
MAPDQREAINAGGIRFHLRDEIRARITAEAKEPALRGEPVTSVNARSSGVGASGWSAGSV